MLHGWGGSKTNFESSLAGGRLQQHTSSRAGVRGSQLHRARLRRLLRRSAAADHSGPCGKGYIHLADTRYEARDTQYLLGLLADQGIVKPQAIGVTGVSYGGGQSMELAFLRDQIRRLDGTLAPWRSPDGSPSDRRRVPPLAVVRPDRRPAPQRPLPRHPGRAARAEPEPGRGSDPELHRRAVRPRLDLRLLLRDAPASTPCTDRDANLPRDFAAIQAGKPLSADALAALRSIYDHNGAYGLRFLDGASRPAPLLIQNGWTDDLFPAAARPSRLQLPSLAVPGLPGQPAVRRPRPQPRLEQGGDEPALLRPGGAVLRRP